MDKTKLTEPNMPSVKISGDGVLPHKWTLLPLRGYLWDTEALVDGKQNLNFFERPYCTSMEWTRNEKTPNDTNLSQSGHLPHPNRFSIFGVHVSTTHLSESDRQNLFFDARITFRFRGDRSYFTAMLSDLTIPMRSKKQWDEAVQRHMALHVEVPEALKDHHEDDCIAKRSEKEPLNLGRYALMIEPAEQFHWTIEWTSPVRLSDFNPVFFRVAMYGIHYVAR